MKEFEYTEEEIYKKIEEIYTSEKGKGFISHLIRSFFPINKQFYLWSPPKDKAKLVCCITGHPLISKDEIMEIEISIAGEKIKLFSQKIITSFESPESEESKKAEEEYQKLLKKNYKGRIMAVSSNESDKYLAAPVSKVLFDWLTNKILSGDKHISWLTKSMRKNEVLKYAQENKINISPKEKSIFNKVVNRPHKLNLMDNEALKQLSEKFKKEK